MEIFQPRHINANTQDLAGNNGIGRYILLPGSDGRAQVIAEHFDNVTIKKHSRGHHLYLGQITYKDQTIDVATIASGMGCGSMEIILHELFHLGANRFLRLGTCGSLQANEVSIGDLVNVQAAVRDEGTTLDYAPKEIPAIPSYEMLSSVMLAYSQLTDTITTTLHTGIAHCKSSFYAREFFSGPQGNSHREYNKILQACGVLATEMETAALFIQSQYYNQLQRKRGFGPRYRVYSGAILGVIAVPNVDHANAKEEAQTITHVINLGLHTVKVMATTIDCVNKVMV